MGLFGAFKGLKDVSLPKGEAVAGLLLIAVATCDKIDPSQKKAVYLHFLDLILSDGNVAPEEEKLAQSIKEALGLDDAFVQNAIAILAEKNKL